MEKMSSIQKLKTYCKQCQENGGGWERVASTEATLMQSTAEPFMSTAFSLFSKSSLMYVCLKLSEAVRNDWAGR